MVIRQVIEEAKRVVVEGEGKREIENISKTMFIAFYSTLLHSPIKIGNSKHQC